MIQGKGLCFGSFVKTGEGGEEVLGGRKTGGVEHLFRGMRERDDLFLDGETYVAGAI